jgi:hypothetical protein
MVELRDVEATFLARHGPTNAGWAAGLPILCGSGAAYRECHCRAEPLVNSLPSALELFRAKCAF